MAPALGCGGSASSHPMLRVAMAIAIARGLRCISPAIGLT
jgi:hypothetical protein